MNHHKNARLTFARRLEMVRLMTEHALTPAAAAAAAGVSACSVIRRTISSRRAKVSRAFLWWFIRCSALEVTGGLAISSLSSPVRMDHPPARNNLLKLHS